MNFFRNKHIMIDLGTGNNNKINWALTNTQELIDLIETVYRGARKGRGLVVSPKDYSTKRVAPRPRKRAPAGLDPNAAQVPLLIGGARPTACACS